MDKPIILIPARLASRRLPNKPLATIGGQEMIIHVAKRAQSADIAPVIIASGDELICQIASKAGVKAILTDPNLPSGSDRCLAALQKMTDGKDYNIIINLQGDMPDIHPLALQKTYQALLESGADCATMVHPCADSDRDNPNQVKAVLALEDKPHPRILYFSRSAIPYGEGQLWGHIGLYVWRRRALEKFARLKPTLLEKREQLEQMRALEHHISFVATMTDNPPLTIDTQADLDKARQVMAP